MNHVLPSSLLRNALRADAVVSGGIAVLQLAAADRLSEMLALPRALLVETGLFLAAYTVLLVVLARARRLPAALIGIVVIGNAGWALGGIALLAAGALAPAPLGTAYVLVQAAGVLMFAALEYAGLRASAPARGAVAA